MARKIIDIGVSGNDATGDSIRESFRKVNENFQELYAVFGAGGQIAFTTLSDTPDTLFGEENKLVIVNADGTALDLKDIIGNRIDIDVNSKYFEYEDLTGGSFAEGSTVTGTTSGASAPIRFVQDGKVFYNPALGNGRSFQDGENVISGSVIAENITVGAAVVVENNSSRLFDDATPKMKASMNAAGNIIGKLGEPSPDVVGDFNSQYGLGATTIDEVAIPKGYADSRYLLKGFVIAIAEITETNPVTVRTLVNHRLDQGDSILINNLIGSIELEGNTYFVDPIDSDTFALYEDADLTTAVDGTSFTPYQAGGRVTFRTKDYITNPVEAAGGATGAEVPQVQEVITRAGSIENRTMQEALYLHDHPGLLAGAGSPNGIEDLQAATKFYVDNTSYASTINLYVSTNGSDTQENTPVGKEGRSPAYAFRTINRAAQKAEELIKDSQTETGPYRQLIAYDNGAAFSEIAGVVPNDNGTGTIRVYFTNNGGARVDQGVEANNDLRPGKIVTGRSSGAKGYIYLYYGASPDPEYTGNDYFDLIPISGQFLEGENLEYGQPVAETNVSIIVESGTYYEDYPIKLSSNVSLYGDEFRRVLIRPADRPSQSPWARTWFFRDTVFDGLTIAETNYGYHYLTDPYNPNSEAKNNRELDVFLCGDASILRQITAQGHGGFVMVLDPEGQILTKSPYFQQGSTFSRSENKQAFRGGQYVDGFAGNLPGTIIEAIENVETGDVDNLVISYTQRPVQTPTSFVVQGSRFTVNTFRPNGDGNADASDLLKNNRNFIAAQTIGYINNELIFDYDPVKCARDVRLIVEALAGDILATGNQQSRTAALAYWDNVVSRVEGQIPQTVSALEFLKDLLPYIVSNNTVSQPYQTAYPRISSAAPVYSSGNTIAVSRSNAAFNEVIDILTNGIDNVDSIDFTPSINSSSNGTNAAEQLQANRAFIQEEVTAWIAAQVTASTPPFSGSFTYDSAKCARDVGYIVDALTYDILYGGNSATVRAAESYFVGAVSQLGVGEEDETIAAYNYLSSIIGDIVQGTPIVSVSGGTQSTSGGVATSTEATELDTLIQIINTVITDGDLLGLPTVSYPDLSGIDADILAARDLLIANRTAIINDTINFIENAFPYLVGNYDESKCRRDTGYIIDAAGYDLALDTNYNAVLTGIAYTRANTAYLQEEQKTETIRAIDYAKAKSAAVMLEDEDNLVITTLEGLVDLITEIIELDPFDLNDVPTVEFNNVASTDVDRVAAYNALLANKDFLAEEVVALVNDKYFVTYNQEKCSRDTKFIVDALVHDLLYTGNLKTAEAAQKYLLPSSAYVLSRYQNTETIQALEYAKSLCQQIVQNVEITGSELYQTDYAQYINEGLSSGVGATTRIGTLIDLITGAIANGKDYLDAQATITAAKTDIQDSVIDFLTTTYSVTVTASSSSNNRFTCSSTANLRTNFPIKFTGTVFGGISTDTTYYILDIPTAGQFRIKARLEDTSPITLTTASGSMTGTLSYNQDTCYRDTGIIVGAIANDFIGGDLQCTRAGIRYRTGTSTAYVVIEEQAPETIAAINHLRDQMLDLFPAGTDLNDALRDKITDSSAIITDIITDINNAPDNVYPKYQLVLDTGTPFYKDLTATNVTMAAIVDDNEIVCSVSTSNIVGGTLLKGHQVSGEGLPNGAFVSFVSVSGSTTNFIIRLRRNSDFAGTAVGSLSFAPPVEITLLTPGNTSMCSNDFTQINDLGYGLVATNNGLVEAVSVFTYYNHIAFYSNNGGQIRSLNGSNAHGNYALVAEGSDPLEIPDDVVLATDTVQVAKIYKRGVHVTDNVADDTAVYITDFDYVPFNVSELEISHPGVGIVRYEISNAQDVSSDDGINISSFTSKTGSGPYLVTFAIPTTSPAPDTGVNYVVTGNANALYNGTFECTTSTTTSITLSYPTDPGVYGAGTTKVYKKEALFRLNLNTGGNNETSTTGLKLELNDGDLVSIRCNQNFKFNEVLDTNPTRPSTALTFTGDPQAEPVYRVIAYDNVGPVIGAFNPDQAVLTFDTSFNYVKLIIDPDNVATADPDDPSATMGSKAGDVKIAVDTLDIASANRINTGQMVIAWYGKKHLVTEYVETVGYNYVSISDIDFNSVPYENKNSSPVAVGLQEPVAPGIGFPVNSFVSKTGAGPYLVTFAIPEQSSAPTTGINYTVVRSGTTAYNDTVNATASTTTSITLSYASDPGTFTTGETDTIIYIDSQKYNTDLLLGDTPTIRAGLSAGEPAEIVVNISTMRATGHDFLDIGTGGFNTTNYPNKIYGSSKAPVQSQEVQERTRGRVFYVSTDQDGFFRVGRFFEVDQGTGTVTFAASIALSNLDGIGFKRGVTVSEFSNDDTMIDAATDTVPTESAVVNYMDRRLGIDVDGTPVDGARLLGDAQLRFLDNKNLNKMEADFNMNGFRIENIELTPVADNEAASKYYVDEQQLSDERVDTVTVAKAANDILVWNSSSNKWVNAETATTGDIQVSLNTSTQALALNIKSGTIINDDINASAAIAQSKLAMNAAAVRSSATGIAQSDLGLASFNNTQFTLTGGWAELQTSTSTTTGVTLDKIQQISSGNLLGRRTSSTGNIETVTPAEIVLDGDGIKNAYFTSSSGDLVFQKTGADVIGGAMTIVLNGKEVCRGTGASWSSVGSSVTSLTITLPATGITGVGTIDAGQVVTRVSGTGGAIPPNSTVTSYNSSTGILVIGWPIAQTVTAGSAATLAFTANGPDYSITDISTSGAANSIVKTDKDGAINLGALKIDGYLVADTSGSTLEVYSPAGGKVLTAAGSGVGIAVTALGSLTAVTDDTVANGVTVNLTAQHTTSGTPAIGIGSGIRFITETATGGNTEIGSVIESVSTNVTAASEAFDLVFKNMTGGAAATEKFRVTSAGNAVLQGDLDVRGGDITTNQTSFNLINATATTLNIGSAATTARLGANSGTLTIGNTTVVGLGTTQTLWNTTATTVNAFGAATVISLGAATGGTTINHGLTVAGDVQVQGGDITTNQTTFNLIDTTATTVNIGGAATTFNIGYDSTAASITNISTGAVAALTIKTVNIATGGVASSTTDVNIGSSSGGTLTVNNPSAVFGGDVEVRGGDITTNQTTFNLINGTATTLNIGNAATTLTLGANTAASYVSVRGTTSASNTTTGALRVAGGAGVAGSLYAAALYDNGNRAVTSVDWVAGTGVTISAETTTGPSATATISIGQAVATNSNVTFNNITSDGLTRFSVNAAVSAAGTTQGTGTALTKQINVVTAGTANQGVVLPTAAAGYRIIVMNQTAVNIKVYPAASDAINGAALNTAYDLPAGARLEFVSVDATNWWTLMATYA